MLRHKFSSEGLGHIRCSEPSPSRSRAEQGKKALVSRLMPAVLSDPHPGLRGGYQLGVLPGVSHAEWLLGDINPGPQIALALAQSLQLLFY